MSTWWGTVGHRFGAGLWVKDGLDFNCPRQERCRASDHL